MRTFIAGTFPSAVLRDVNERVARIRSRVPPVSWIRPESQHLTFAFLGEQDEAFVQPICDAVGIRIAALAPFEASVRGSGFFPNSRNARVAWLGVEPEAPLHLLAAAIRAGVADAGVKLDAAEFKAHLTLCRMREPWPPACNTIFQTAFAAIDSPAFLLRSVTMFSSRLDPSGAVHTPLSILSLGAGNTPDRS